jgi:hypothetical protein
MFPWYIKNTIIQKKSYNFNIKLNYDFKTWKNKTNITLAMVRVIVITPMEPFSWHIYRIKNQQKWTKGGP